MLSIKDKLQLQKTVKAGLTRLAEGISDIRARLAVQKDIKEALTRLGESVGDTRPQKLIDLINGKFNSLDPLAFIRIVKEVVEEIGGDITPIKPPAVNYIRANQDAILESAMGTMWKQS